MIIHVSGVGAGLGRASAERRLPWYRAEHAPFRVVFIFHSHAKIPVLLLDFKYRQQLDKRTRKPTLGGGLRGRVFVLQRIP
jgi:hypothetical protein